MAMASGYLLSLPLRAEEEVEEAVLLSRLREAIAILVPFIACQPRSMHRERNTLTKRLPLSSRITGP